MKKDLDFIKLLNAALVMGAIVFLAAAHFVSKETGGLSSDIEIYRIMLMVSNIVAPLSIIGGLAFFRTRLRGIETLELPDKLKKYREAMIIRSASIEGACVLFAVCLLLTGSMVFLLEAVFVILFLIFHFPTVNRIAKETRHDIRDLV